MIRHLEEKDEESDDHHSGEEEEGASSLHPRPTLRRNQALNNNKPIYLSKYGIRFKLGEKVEARQRSAHFTLYFPGRIRSVNADGTYDVLFDDGKKEIRITPDHIRPREPDRSGICSIS
jgi:hypothetical protein